MGASRRSAGEPLSMRRRDASVFVAKNWKMDSMQRALMSSQDRNPSAYATGFLRHTLAGLATLQALLVDDALALLEYAMSQALIPSGSVDWACDAALHILR